MRTRLSSHAPTAERSSSGAASCVESLVGRISAQSVALPGPRRFLAVGKIILMVKIFPKEADTDLELLKQKVTNSLPASASVHAFSEEPIAFGLKALIATIVLPEEGFGDLEAVEESIRKIDYVSEIETVMVRRV